MQFSSARVGRFNPKRHPYYIYAADFRDNSAGVTALHYLCHSLNCAGEAAFLLNTTVTKPGLNVRFLSKADCSHHQESDVVPIMIYPEIVSDNPYNAVAVVRYMLNHDGLLTGRKIEWTGIDLVFYHSPEFVPSGVKSPQIMQVPVLDDDLFSPSKNKPQRKQSYLLISRVNPADIDYSQLPSDVQILDIAHPKSLLELAAIFQTAKVLYSYEISGTCVCAMPCGCPVLYVRNSSLTKIPGQSDYSTNGSAFIDEPNGFERAQATVGRVRKHWQRVKDQFPRQLENFIDKTQAHGDKIGVHNYRAVEYIRNTLFSHQSSQATAV